MSPYLLLLLIGTSAGLTNMVPWGGPTGRAVSILNVSPSELWYRSYRFSLIGVVFVLGMAFICGIHSCIKYHPCELYIYDWAITRTFN